LYQNLHLILAGGGSDRGRVGDFARSIGVGRQIHLTGPRPDLGPLLARAEVVWVPSLRRGGVGAALEAMAAGRPVVASRVPGLNEVVCDGETGYLVPPGDKPALARQTRLLLDDPDRRAGFGAAARRAAGLFGPAQLVRAAIPLYQGAGPIAAIPS
jgi:glycosyltransferase involved in cell wall biosynthesis